MGNLIDKMNKKYGDLTVVDLSTRRDEKGRVFWICKCNKCEKFIEVRGDNLRFNNSSRCSNCSIGGKRSKFVKKVKDEWIYIKDM